MKDNAAQTKHGLMDKVNYTADFLKRKRICFEKSRSFQWKNKIYYILWSITDRQADKTILRVEAHKS